MLFKWSSYCTQLIFWNWMSIVSFSCSSLGNIVFLWLMKFFLKFFDKINWDWWSKWCCYNVADQIGWGRFICKNIVSVWDFEVICVVLVLWDRKESENISRKSETFSLSNINSSSLKSPYETTDLFSWLSFSKKKKEWNKVIIIQIG